MRERERERERLHLRTMKACNVFFEKTFTSLISLSLSLPSLYFLFVAVEVVKGGVGESEGGVEMWVCR